MKIAVIPHEEIEALRSDLNEVKELLYKYNMCSSGEKNGDEWLSSAEAARYLGVTTRTIQNGLLRVYYLCHIQVVNFVLSAVNLMPFSSATLLIAKVMDIGPTTQARPP